MSWPHNCWVTVNMHQTSVHQQQLSCRNRHNVCRIVCQPLTDFFFSTVLHDVLNMRPSVMASLQERTCPVYKKICQLTNSDGSAGGPVHLVVGNAGYELSWFANPSPPNYWDKIVLEHGYSRCTANQTTLTCEVRLQHNIAANVD